MAKKNENTDAKQTFTVQAGMLTLNNVTVKDAGRSLTSLYNQERRPLLEPFAKMVRDGLISAGPLSSLKMKNYMQDLRTVKGFDNLPETALTQLYNSFDATLLNVMAVAKADKRYEEAWKHLVTNLVVSSQELRMQLGREPRVGGAYSWHYAYFPELLFSPLIVTDIWHDYSPTYRDRQQHGMLTMDIGTRCMLSDYFFGPDFRKPHLSAQLPESTNLQIEDFEQATAADLVTIEGIALNGSPLSSNGSISAAAVKKIKTQTPIPDFDVKAGERPLDRVEMLCLTYFTLRDNLGDNAKKEIDIKRLAKFTVEYMARWIIGPNYGTFIPELQGFTKVWTSGNYTSTVSRTVQYILMEAKEDWLDLSNFKMQLLCTSKEGDRNYIYLYLFPEENRRKAKLIRKADKERGKDNGARIRWFEDVGLKFAIHWIKYLCAMGIVELAMDTGVKDIADDPMEGMRYVRLTPLGHYAFGIDKDYTPKAASADTGVEFDPRNGIITIDAKSPYQMFLGNVAKRISPTRFSISSESLLKGCKTKWELEQRINNLQTILNPEKEPAIRKIIDNAMLRTDCAQREGGYSLLKLRGDLPGLRQVILSNYELRQMTILAGPGLALVKTSKLERFNTILASYGYLLE